MSIWERISCHNFVEVEGYAYFSNWFYNGLFKVEIKTGKTFFLGYFEDEKLFEKNIHWELCLKEGRIFFLPRRGRHVHVYKLSDRSIYSIEIRREFDNFFVIDEVVFGDDYFIFIPENKDYPIKKLDLRRLEVIEIDSQVMMRIQKQHRIQHVYKDAFLTSRLMKEYQVERADQVLWKKMPDENWYGFLPMGRQLISYSEKLNKLNRIPLIIMNDNELKKYLCKVKQDIFRERSILENIMGLQQFLNEVAVMDGDNLNRSNLRNNDGIGKNIWELLKK